jgi:ParB family chromosome partitioning protein
MAPKRRGLGRGLGALIPSGPTTEQDAADPNTTNDPDDPERAVSERHPGTRAEEETGSTLVAVPARYLEIPVGDIVPNPRQPRLVFEDEAMAELVHSISQIGLLQPIVVRSTGNGSYELVAGERRWRATQAAGLTVIPAIVRETADDAMLRDALLENLHRSSLNPLEEAAAYQQLLDDFQCTQEELATRIGRSRPQVSNTIRLLRLPAPVARRVAAGVLSAGHARAILSLDDAAAMEALAGRVVAEGLSVRATEEIVSVGAPGGTTKKRRTRVSSSTPDDVLELVDRVAERLETRVVANGGARGRLVIDYASIEDLQRIVALID